jgi:twinkle protein
MSGEFVKHMACPDCGSKDNAALYEDGNVYCHGECQKVVIRGEQEEHGTFEVDVNAEPRPNFIPVTHQAIRSRKISEETCKFFGYGVGEYMGQVVHVCNIYSEESKRIAQKIRFKNKDFNIIGKLGKDTLIGMHKWRGGKRLVITEGEIDMLSVYEVGKNQFPVVSLPHGAGNAAKAITGSEQFLKKFDEILLFFDNDKAGQDATQDCKKLLGPRCKVVLLNGYKDANEALKEGKAQEIISAIYNAKSYKPSAVVTVSDVRAQVMKKPQMGLSFPWPTATKASLGIRKGEIHIVAAAPKIGKTEHQHELIQHVTEVHKLVVGVFSLEEPPVKTVRKIAGKYMGEQFTKPQEVAGWTDEALEQGVDYIDEKIEMYSSEGVRDHNEILSTARYWAGKGMWLFILDPITALVAEHDSSSANDMLNEFMSKAASLCLELGITFFMYSHVNPAKHGKPHDEGGRILSSQLTGSRAMEKWAHYGWGIERNRMLDDKTARNRSQHVLLFDREFGEHCKYTCTYDDIKNSYLEVDSFEDTEEEHEFA